MLGNEQLSPGTDIVALARFRPRDPESAARIDGGKNVYMPVEQIGLGTSKQLEVGRLQGHLARIPPQVNRSCALACRCEDHAFVIPTLGGKTELADALWLPTSCKLFGMKSAPATSRSREPGLRRFAASTASLL